MVRSLRFKHEWEDDHDFYEDRDYYEDYGDNEEDDIVYDQDDYGQDPDDYPDPDDYNDYDDREEEDIVYDHDDYDQDPDDYPSPDDYNDYNDDYDVYGQEDNYDEYQVCTGMSRDRHKERWRDSPLYFSTLDFIQFKFSSVFLQCLVLPT